MEKNQPHSDRRSEFFNVFNVDEKLAILYITLRIIALSLNNKGVDE
jgi:hypothetical protein